MGLRPDDLARLWDLHAGEILGFFVRRIYDPEVSVDLLAETFAAAISRCHQFRGGDDATARAWLFAIARNELNEFVRRGQAERRALAKLGVQRRALTDAEYDRIEDLAASGPLRSEVASQLAELPLGQRDVLRMRVIEEQTYDTVARSLGISEQTARARVSRALRALRGSHIKPDMKEASEHA
jgi:RNA polymerase sigma-70 factor (ECF subfamily)